MQIWLQAPLFLNYFFLKTIVQKWQEKWKKKKQRPYANWLRQGWHLDYCREKNQHYLSLIYFNTEKLFTRYKRSISHTFWNTLWNTCTHQVPSMVPDGCNHSSCSNPRVVRLSDFVFAFEPDCDYRWELMALVSDFYVLCHWDVPTSVSPDLVRSVFFCLFKHLPFLSVHFQMFISWFWIIY